MIDTPMYAIELEKKLIAEFKFQFEEKLGYTPVVLTKYETNEYMIPFMSLNRLARAFEPFLPTLYDNKITLYSKSRKREIVELRMIFCFLARSMRNTLGTIGDFLGGRDHTTVIHNITTFVNLMETNEQFKNQFFEIINHIKQNHESSIMDQSNTTQCLPEPALFS